MLKINIMLRALALLRAHADLRLLFLDALLADEPQARGQQREPAAAARRLVRSRPWGRPPAMDASARTPGAPDGPGAPGTGPGTRTYLWST